MNTKDNRSVSVKRRNRKRKKLLLPIAGVAAAFVVVLIVLFAVILPSGLKKTDKGLIYQHFGRTVTDKWETVKKKTYYFDKKGYAVTGWQKIKKATYYFDQDAVRVTGWLKLDGKKYYLIPKNGKMVTGNYKIKKHNYYFSEEDGSLQTGVIRKENQLIASADDKGILQTGVVEIEGVKYCFNDDGLIQSGWLTANGHKYYDQTDGSVLLGKQQIDGVWYYFKEDTGLQTGVCLTEQGETIYANEQGVLQTGDVEVNGKHYFFNEDATAVRGWIDTDDEKRYYAGDDGAFLTGTQTINNTTYTFDQTGLLLSKDSENPKMVALTFDDGPAANTDRVLDILQMYNCKATFFVVGSRVQRYSAQLKRAFDMGCEIGSHTYNHRYLTGLSDEEVQTEINMTNDVVKSITGQETTALRPPGGFYNDKVKELAGNPIIQWNVDTQDWKSRNPQSIFNIATTNIKDGDIILMHDLYSTTADAVGIIVPALLEQGFQIVTITELLDAHGGAFNGKVYFSADKVQ